MTNQFLHKEYELCFGQLRFYDERQNSLLKFFFSFVSAIAAAQLAIYKMFNSLTEDFLLFFTFLSLIVLVCSILVFLSMVQNRLYFVFMARQINALRGHMLKEEASEFTENQLYTRTDFSAIKPFSVHTYQMFGVAFVTSLYGGSATYSIHKLFCTDSPWFLVGLVFFLLTMGLSAGGYFYLKNQGNKSADEAVHHKD